MDDYQKIIINDLVTAHAGLMHIDTLEPRDMDETTLWLQTHYTRRLGKFAPTLRPVVAERCERMGHARFANWHGEYGMKLLARRVEQHAAYAG